MCTRPSLPWPLAPTGSVSVLPQQRPMRSPSSTPLSTLAIATAWSSPRISPTATRSSPNRLTASYSSTSAKRINGRFCGTTVPPTTASPDSLSGGSVLAIPRRAAAPGLPWLGLLLLDDAAHLVCTDQAPTCQGLWKPLPVGCRNPRKGEGGWGV